MGRFQNLKVLALIFEDHDLLQWIAKKEKQYGESFKSRTAGSDPANGGANPSSPAIRIESSDSRGPISLLGRSVIAIRNHAG
jgi:hypothetical protein